MALRASGWWQVLPVLGAIAAMVGFFFPFIDIQATGWPISISAYDVVTGSADVGRLIEALESGQPVTPEQREALLRFRELTRDYGAALLVLYVPAVIQLLTSGVGWLGSFGRGKGIVVLLVGIASLGIFYAFRSVQPDPSTGVKLGGGLIGIAIAGGLGVVGGIGALINPDPD